MIIFFNEGGQREYNGLVDVYRKTLASDGIQGLYRGFVISCVGIVVYRGCYFGFYDTLKPILLGEKDASLFLSFCLGYGKYNSDIILNFYALNFEKIFNYHSIIC